MQKKVLLLVLLVLFSVFFVFAISNNGWLITARAAGCANDNECSGSDVCEGGSCVLEAGRLGGASCKFDDNCAAYWCLITPGQAAGVCGCEVYEGGPPNGGCPQGQSCNSETHACEAGGTSCQDDAACPNGWFCNLYGEDENAIPNPDYVVCEGAEDPDLDEPHCVQPAKKNFCQPSYELSRGKQCVGANCLNLGYGRSQTYMGDVNWWEFSRDGMLTAKISSVSDNRLCFIYIYDPCKLGNGNIAYQNNAGQRGIIGLLNKENAPERCFFNWMWYNLNHLGQGSIKLRIGEITPSVYLRAWMFGYVTNEGGPGKDGTESVWCCDQPTDCVDDAPSGVTASGNPTSINGPCYNTGRKIDVDNNGVEDICLSGKWYEKCGPEQPFCDGGTQCDLNEGSATKGYCIIPEPAGEGAGPGAGGPGAVFKRVGLTNVFQRVS